MPQYRISRRGTRYHGIPNLVQRLPPYGPQRVGQVTSLSPQAIMLRISPAGSRLPRGLRSSIRGQLAASASGCMDMDDEQVAADVICVAASRYLLVNLASWLPGGFPLIHRSVHTPHNGAPQRQSKCIIGNEPKS